MALATVPNTFMIPGRGAPERIYTDEAAGAESAFSVDLARKAVDESYGTSDAAPFLTQRALEKRTINLYSPDHAFDPALLGTMTEEAASHAQASTETSPSGETDTAARLRITQITAFLEACRVTHLQQINKGRSS